MAHLTLIAAAYDIQLYIRVYIRIIPHVSHI